MLSFNPFFLKRHGVFLGMLASIVLSACSSTVTVNVTRFHEITSAEQLAELDGAQKRYQFTEELEKSNDLEKKQFAKLIAQELQNLGFNQTKQALYKIDFKTSAPKSIMQSMQPSMSPSFYGGMGLGGRYGRSYIGFTNYVPVNYELYRNTLELEVYEVKSGKRVWQSKSEIDTVGTANIPGLIPYLVRASLQGFPGESGQTVKFEYKLPEEDDADELPSSKLPSSNSQTMPK